MHFDAINSTLEVFSYDRFTEAVFTHGTVDFSNTLYNSCATVLHIGQKHQEAHALHSIDRCDAGRDI